MAASPPLTSARFFFLAFLFLLLFSSADAQQKTDATEADTLKAIFSEWDKHSPFFSINWNVSEDLCHTSANGSYIRCDCSFNNSTTCHVIELNATNLDIDIQFPTGLDNLTRLKTLNLHGNYFQGPIPPVIGNMTDLQFLDLGSNVLSGNIPKELGKLQNLSYLDIGINNFNGSLPEELGNLTNLQALHLNSLGISGSIPSTFQNLTKLETLWISDNFTGNFPNFIGKFLQLKDLRLQGNSFVGSIPSTFSHLVNLTDLRIGEVSGDSSKLLDIRNMTQLEILILRNCNISDNIPSYFGRNNTKLRHLDLSFNQLTGSFPPQLFKMQSLEYLSLGNNSLNGDLPSRENASYFIDLSYNMFSGNFPPWLNGSYKVNLVGNNFTYDSGASDVSKLQYLQRAFSYSDLTYAKFGINSGGSDSVNTSDVFYASDDADLEDIPYNISNDTRWAVSSTGKFLDVVGPTYVQNIQSVFEGTQNPDLFLDMRLSASSLRYYGLGLENGNYTVKLYFGETQDYWDNRKGRRLFDIYIQEILVRKDFDITEGAHGFVKTAVEFIHYASVENHILVIHLFWAGKGTCCVPNKMSYGPSISALSIFAVSQPLPSSKSNRNASLIGGISAAVAFLLVMFVAGIIIWKWKHKSIQDEEFLALTIKPKLFSYEELKISTGGFDQANKLGQGGFGSVFMGTLSDGDQVAIKKLTVSSDEGKIQFITEVATVSTVKHRNLVTLLGCCCEGKRRLLVYEYMMNKSLDKVLFGKTDIHLDWSARFKICLGTARGLAYLHEESSIRIIHRDVKASNILLDEDLSPKISDFGLAKPYDYKMSHISTRVAGTVGYLAPEYALRGQLTEKVDVFGFGVVAFETLTGKPNTQEGPIGEKTYLLDWVWHLHEKGNDLELVDETLTSYNQEEALRLIKVALMCTQASATKRPTMSRVVAMLVGDMEVLEVQGRPSYLMDWRYCDKFSVSSTSTYTTTFTSTSPTRLLEIPE